MLTRGLRRRRHVDRAASLDALGRRAMTRLAEFTDWLTVNDVHGYVGEFGWPRDGDAAEWGAIGEVFLDALDDADLWATYWATGEAWGDGYPLLAYGDSGGALNTAYAPSGPLERHLSAGGYRRGVCVAGGEFYSPAFSNVNPENNVANYSSAGTYTYLAGRGMDLARIAFRWERLQPQLGAALDATALAALTAAVNAAGAAGMSVILDCHNYAGYFTAGHVLHRIGSAEVTVAHFADLWDRLSTAFAGNAAVVGYGLMNEPGSLPSVDSIYTDRATLNTFASTVENWTVGGATWSAGQGGSLAVVPASNATTVLREADTTLRDRSGNGLVFWADVFVPSDAAGNYDLTLQARDGAYGFLRQDAVRLAKGSVTRLPLVLTQPQAQAMRGLEINFGGTPDGTSTVNVLGVWQGDYMSLGGPEATWEAASQAAVTAIRGNADTTAVMVAGYFIFGGGSWGPDGAHPTAWISDPADNVFYEHHQYFDYSTTGLYTSSYADDLASAQAAE